ncbi:unnamed protein product [Strongylus vulgaris]|uniref:Uncharacterized protein n=1 Tax=Strongylus vulgaris TaxID=40348 RepID=A0A3P7LJ02_STRVU|nr:unnamed protein product [Strongylus vulgaris]
MIYGYIPHVERFMIAAMKARQRLQTSVYLELIKMWLKVEDTALLHCLLDADEEQTSLSTGLDRAKVFIFAYIVMHMHPYGIVQEGESYCMARTVVDHADARKSVERLMKKFERRETLFPPLQLCEKNRLLYYSGAKRANAKAKGFLKAETTGLQLWRSEDNEMLVQRM